MRFTKEYLMDRTNRELDKRNIPRLFRSSSISDFKILGDTKAERKHNKVQFELFIDYFKNLDKHLANGYGLVLTGPCGVGKTMLLSIVLLESYYLCQNWNYVFNNISTDVNPTLAEKLENNYVHDVYFIQGTTLGQMMFTQNLNDKEMNLRRHLKTFTALAIDDITKMMETKMGNEVSFMDDIIRHRNLMKLSTFISCQTTIDALKDKLSEPLYDLIHGNSLVLTFVGESQRPKS